MILLLSLRTWIDAKIELFPLIKPHFCQPGIIMVDNLWSSPRKSIRGWFSENMPNMWTSGNHQFTTAHPNLQGKTITELELETTVFVHILTQYFISIQFTLRNSVWKLFKKSHSKLRAKRASFSLWMYKSSLKMPKFVLFGQFLKTLSLRSNSVTRHVNFNRTKMVENAKIKNSNATFWVIFKHCAHAKSVQK